MRSPASPHPLDHPRLYGNRVAVCDHKLRQRLSLALCLACSTMVHLADDACACNPFPHAVATSTPDIPTPRAPLTSCAPEGTVSPGHKAQSPVLARDPPSEEMCVWHCAATPSPKEGFLRPPERSCLPQSFMLRLLDEPTASCSNLPRVTKGAFCARLGDRSFL
jgi:hypothetical protein